MTEQDHKYLKVFYNTRLKMEGMPDFEKLSDENRESIYNMTLFKVFRLNKAFKDLGEALGLPKLKRWFIGS